MCRECGLGASSMFGFGCWGVGSRVSTEGAFKFGLLRSAKLKLCLPTDTLKDSNRASGKPSYICPQIYDRNGCSPLACQISTSLRAGPS